VTDLEPLLALQARDLALDRLEHERADLPERARLAGLTGRLAELAVRRDAQRGDRDEVARQEQRLADEVQQLGAQIRSTERRLYSGEISSPRELQALQADVEQLRRRQRTLEDRELSAMEQREPLDEALAALDGEHAELAREVDAVRQQLDERERALVLALTSEHAARDDAARGLDATLVASYEQRRARAKGVGAARLVGSTCQGCHLSIPATEVDRIRRQPPGTLAYCDNCGAILVP
jgi:predicted  nucleic acid-binding Zn-ribbon protein